MADSDVHQRVQRLLAEYPLIDGHNDLPIQLRIHFHNKIYDPKCTFRDGLFTETDLVKLKKGQVGGQFWSVYVECGAPNEDWNDDQSAVRDTLEQIDVIKRLIDDHEQLELCTEPDAVLTAFGNGRIASMIGAEGLHQVGHSIANIRMLFELGVRYITVTHNANNAFATCATHVTAGGDDAGLTEFGVAGIKEMNRLGMLVDLSHVSVKTMEDTLAVTRAPVIFSHSGARGLSDHARNVPDHVLRRVRKNRGVVMVPFVTVFLKVTDPDSASVEDIVDHIYHIVGIAGWDHVGIGSDFDGYAPLPKGMQDTSCYPSLIVAVCARGATDEQVKKLMGGNVLRVWHEVVDISQKIKKTGEKPSEVTAPGRNWGLSDANLSG
ncbi:dipeptidyl aminopeptidase [Exophiala viscosa]|uniref:Dipeptidase n=1 Tax=Exophiala viscosa TaxID=2486360 RepID=A0AAN6DMH6_9EURO|nr:dipeptidyl aminopeptidase [Exophiala viscosa]KAI1620898.1 dipeptidyl aminopeptidase [Exophiala viscosa]